MKVALLGSKDFDSLEYHLQDSLAFLGHSVFHIDIKDIVNIPYMYNYWGNKIFSSYNEFIFKKIAIKIIEQEPDLVFCTYRFINPIAITLIKSALPNIPVIHINPDQLTTLEHQQIFASPYDAYFSKDPFMVDFMKNKMNLNALYLPEALNTRLHKMPLVNREQLELDLDIDVIAFGTMYPYRTKMISELVKKGVNMTLFGTPDRRFPRKEITNNFRNEFITGDRKAEILFGSKIVFNNFHYAEVESVNVKFFEIAGIGGFQICDYKPIIEEYSTIAPEKFTFKNIKQAYELIEYYLKQPEERHKLAFLQCEYFHLHHTYEHRINQILQSL